MNILILSPHTDDAELGCGGSIIKFLERGDTIFWVVFSTAEESVPDGLPKGVLKDEFQKVIQHIGLQPENCRILNFMVRYLHMNRQKILEDLVNLRTTFKPDLVIGPSVHDLHQDHQVVANEMLRAFKTTAGILGYELPWNHVTFHTQLFVKLEKKHIIKKCDMLKMYRSQIVAKKSYFTEDFIFGLAKARGVQCSAEYAESFEVLRWIM